MAKEPDGHRYTRNCVECNTVFRTFPSVVKKGMGKFCGQTCARSFNTKAAQLRNTRRCLQCKKKFVAAIQNIVRGNGKLCSRDCQKAWQSVAKKGKKPYEMTDSTREKLRLNKLGKPNPTKGIPRPHTRKENPIGNSNRDKRIMGRLEYKQWRTAVFTRDNYTCQICDQYGGTLHADHIERWADNEELRYNVDNGRTLCVPCHYYITFKTKMKPGTKWCNFTARKTG